MPTRTSTYRPALIARLFSVGSWRLSLSPLEPWRILLQDDAVGDLSCAAIDAISTKKNRFWHTVEIRSGARTDNLPGLSRSAAARLEKDITAFVNDHLCVEIVSQGDRLRALDAELHGIIEARTRYLAKSDLTRAIAGVPGRAATALSHPLLDPARAATTIAGVLPRSFALMADPAVRDRYNDGFIISELARFRSFFDDLDGRSLSDQQREACIRLEDNNLLVASAGSGKSATMVGKVAYVIEKKLYRAEEILVLAYNKSAADELRVRIDRQLKVAEGQLACRVTTFHALGRGIIEEVLGRPQQLANWVEHPAGEAKAIEDIIQDLVRTDDGFKRQWVDLLVLHHKADIPREVFDTETDFQRYVTERRTKGRATIGSLSGVYVKSLQEQSIANWLWLNSVSFEYEKQIGAPNMAHGFGLDIVSKFFSDMAGAIIAQKAGLVMHMGLVAP